MSTELKILFVEDVHTDAELAMRILERAGIQFQSRVVQTETDFLHELEKFVPDIIISDYQMPQFNGMRVLDITLEKCPATPFILLTGSVNEEIAVECMKSGATDYIIKEHIARLPMAIKDALEKNKIILGKEKAELQLIESEKRFRSIYENSTIGLYRTTPAGKIILANPALIKMLGYSSFEELAKRNLQKNGFEPSHERKLFHEQIMKNGEVIGLESAWIRKDETVLYIRESAKIINDANGNILYYDGTVEDITARKKAEEALRESEDRYRDLVEHSSELFCTHDLDGNVLSVNSAALKITGYSQEEVLTMNLQNIIVPEYRKIFNAYLKKILTIGHAHGIMIIQTKTGERRIWEYNNSLRTHGVDKPIVRGMVKDITERKQAEERTKTYIHFLESLERIDHDIKREVDIEPMLWSVVNTVFSIFDCDRAWLFYPCDPDAQSFRVPVEVNKPEYPGANAKNIDVPMSPDLADNLREALELGDVVTYLIGTDRPINKVTAEQFGVQSQMMVPIYPKVGKPWVFGMHQCSYARIWTNDEQQLFKEISRRVADSLTNLLMFQNLKESEERYRMLFELSADGILFADAETRTFKYANPAMCRMLGYTEEELTTMSIADIHSNQDLQWVITEFEAVTRRDKSLVLDVPCLRKDGTILYTDINSTSITIDGRLYNLGLFRDITERKHAEEELKKKNSFIQTVLDNLPIGIALNEIDKGNSFYINKKFEEIYGWPQDEMKDTSVFFKKVYPDEKYRKELMAKIIADIQSGDPSRMHWEECLVTHKDGSEHVVNAVNIPLSEQNTMVSTVIDITERKRGEDILRESELRFRSVWEKGTDGMRITNEEGIILLVNDAYCKMVEKPCEEMEGKPISIVYEVAKRAEILRKHKERFRSRSIPAHLERELVLWNGKRIVLELSNTFLENPHQLTLSLSVFKNITERKQAEEILTNERTLLRTIIDLIPDAVFVKDIEGRKILANKKEIEFSGKNSENDVIGKTDFDLYPESEAKRYFEEDQSVIKSGKPLLNIEGRLIDKDGAPHWLLGAKVPLRDMHGNITGLVGVNHDFTERKQFEDELLKLSRAVEQSPASVVITNPQGDIEYVNHKFCEITGFTKEEVIGQNPRILKSGIQDKKYYEDLWNTILNGKEWKGEFLDKKKNGELYWESALISPLLNKNGEITHFVAVKEDITEKKKMIEELVISKDKAEEMNRLKSNFLANMSHELRTPLNGILGYAEILTTLLEDAEQVDMVQGIYQSGKRLSETLKFILDLSEAETGKIEVIAKDVSVVPIIKESVLLFAADASKKNIQLETIIQDENIIAHLDGILLKRILHNLIDNAIKFTKEGNIKVEVGIEELNVKGSSKQPPIFYINVKDTGIGIPEDKIDLIWEEFRQVSEGISRNYEGPGLGLTISKKAVELMHGTITVKSEYGVGSTFTVKFPAIVASSSRIENYDEESKLIQMPVDSSIGKSFSASVLYVEDDFINRNMVKLFLKDTCEVDTAEDGISALKLLNEKKYDFFMIDINLGEGMNGLELVKEILNLSQYANTPIAAVTAYALGKDKTESLAAGCTHYLAKPFRRKEMIDLVKRALLNE
ncbi:MAG: PAS domain S-box protein [Ignavibacteriaceae bacterium]|jgi:hypothetical protein